MKELELVTDFLNSLYVLSHQFGFVMFVYLMRIMAENCLDLIKMHLIGEELRRVILKS